MHSLIIFLSFSLFVWILITIFLHLVQRWRPVLLEKFTEKHDVAISFAHAQYHTDRFNGWLSSFGRKHRRLLAYWFDIGVVFGVLAGAAAIVFMIVSLLQTLLQPRQDTVLTPVIPGVNVPQHELSFYFLAVLVGGAFHEFAHAVAAAALDCRIRTVGLFIAFVYPGAFVDLNATDVDALPSWHRLRIYAGGAYHNIVLALFAYLLSSTQSTLLSPLFVSNESNGVTVVPMHTSTLVSLFQPNDRIVSVDNWFVYWRTCLQARAFNSSRSLPHGYCVDGDQTASIQLHSDKDSDCCQSQSLSGLQCFHFDPLFNVDVDSIDDVLGNEINSTLCLSSKHYIDLHRNATRCDKSQDCVDGQRRHRRCLIPNFSHSTQRLILLRIKRYEDTMETMFCGSAEELWHSLHVSETSPRFHRLSFILSFLFNIDYNAIPERLSALLFYTASLNLAMGMLNMAPVYRMDGSYALHALLELLVYWHAGPMVRRPSVQCERRIERIERVTLKCGTSLTVLTVAVGLVKLIFA